LTSRAKLADASRSIAIAGCGRGQPRWSVKVKPSLVSSSIACPRRSQLSAAACSSLQQHQAVGDEPEIGRHLVPPSLTFGAQMTGCRFRLVPGRFEAIWPDLTDDRQGSRRFTTPLCHSKYLHFYYAISRFYPKSIGLANFGRSRAGKCGPSSNFLGSPLAPSLASDANELFTSTPSHLSGMSRTTFVFSMLFDEFHADPGQVRFSEPGGHVPAREHAPRAGPHRPSPRLRGRDRNSKRPPSRREEVLGEHRQIPSAATGRQVPAGQW
jgi:hypothetical protein